MLDNETAILKFLQHQQYDTAKSTDASYAVTFDIYRQGFGTVIVSLPFKGLDLADLLGTSWDAYQAVGYSQILISRIDGEDLGTDEIDALEKAVTRDLFFDYDEEELDISFDPDSIDGVLVVFVYEM